MNLPPNATAAIVDLLSAQARYTNLRNADGLLGSPSETDGLMMEMEATVRDAEQALLTIFTECFGAPDVEHPEP